MTSVAQRLPREARKAKILEAATAVFGERGYDGASMDVIGERTGVTKPILYRHYGSKEGLFIACAMHAWTQMGLAIYEAATSPGTPDVRLYRGNLAYFKFLEEHRAIWRVLYPQDSKGDPELAKRVREAQRGAVTMMTGLFLNTAEEEQVDPGMLELAEPMAWGFVGASTAIAARWQEHPEESAELQAERLTNLCWQGFERMLRGDLWEPPTGD